MGVDTRDPGFWRSGYLGALLGKDLVKFLGDFQLVIFL